MSKAIKNFDLFEISNAHCPERGLLRHAYVYHSSFTCTFVEPSNKGKSFKAEERQAGCWLYVWELEPKKTLG